MTFARAARRILAEAEATSTADNANNNNNILRTLRDYDTLRRTATNVERIGSIDLVTLDKNDDEDVVILDQNTTTTGTVPTTTFIPYMNFAMVMPFSGYRPNRIPLENGVFQGLAAVLLAVEHLNTRNSTLVEEIGDVFGSMDNQKCPIKFTLQAYDSSLSQIEAVDHMINLISIDPTATASGNADEEKSSLLPSAFIGAARSAVSIPTSIITGLRGFPQISPISTSTQLDDKLQFPLFGRTIPSDAGTAIPAILYLRYKLNVKHLAVLHVNDAYGNAYSLGLQLAASTYAPDMIIKSYDFPFQTSPEIVEQTISLLKSTEYRYFFGVIFSTVHYDPFMIEAYKQNIAGTGEHIWMFSDSVSTSVFARNFEVGSDLHLASRGSSRIGAVGGVPGITKYDLFLQSMLDLSNNVVDSDIIQSYHPTYPNEPDYVPYQIKDDPEFFNKASAGVVPFLYDAVIALGLAACNATLANSIDGTYDYDYFIANNSTTLPTFSFFDGIELYEQYKNTTFDGASGYNIYDSVTGTRTSSSARFTLLNFIEDTSTITTEIVLDEESGMNKTIQTIQFQTVETDVFSNSEWNSVKPLIFNDGSTIPPPDLEQLIRNDNHIGKSLRIVGYCLSSCIMILSIGMILWTYIYRTEHVVKASQPIFLYMISVGCFLMGGLSILFLSFDDEIVTPQTCSVFCIVVPWLLSFGWIISFSALFTKTKRVNQIFLHNPNYRRIKVTVVDVMKPALFLMILTAIILTTWTILSPPKWTRDVSLIDQFGRIVETKGKCNFHSHDSIPYLVSLGIVLLGALAYSVYEAYMARHVSTEFSESEYIFLVLCTILLMSFLGIPVMVIAREEPKARFFVAVGVLFIICLAILLLMFAPKIIAFRLSQTRRASSMEFVQQIQQLRREQQAHRVSGFFSVPGGGDHRRASGLRRTLVTGINPNSEMSTVSRLETQVEDSADNTNMTDSSEEDNDGIRIMNHPKELETLKKLVQELQSENATLRQRHNQQRQQEPQQEPLQQQPESSTSQIPSSSSPPHISINMIGEISESSDPETTKLE